MMNYKHDFSILRVDEFLLMKMEIVNNLIQLIPFLSYEVNAWHVIDRTGFDVVGRIIIMMILVENSVST